ncbi:hypothetical protein JV173_00180 [Acholeplasma equirhinis]|uniref:hypothetical protein n=1 Tax=Acholeplasma equirhinis TaxID=555393 RepID=UPI00197AEC14|nr:hypothetical protein [Acholeplasma equirhinis]MBN3489919.1 hypothetical protein [Acholeplasma equirhinis]
MILVQKMDSDIWYGLYLFNDKIYACELDTIKENSEIMLNGITFLLAISAFKDRWKFLNILKVIFEEIYDEEAVDRLLLINDTIPNHDDENQKIN